MAIDEVLLCVRLVLGLLLLAAGVAKLGTAERDETLEAIGNYRVLPGALRMQVAAALPYSEMTLAALLLAGVLISIAAAAAALLLGAFAASMAWHVSRGAQFGCGCGSGHQISWVLVTRNVCFCVLAASVTVGPSSALSIWAGPGQTAPTIPFDAALPMPLIAVTLVLSARLIDSLRPAGRVPSSQRVGVA
jgi:uncharacterized membrane protein YphA (DoxX/SURF4 family)